MHEISLAQGIIKTAEDTLKQENAKEVLSITVRMGPMSGVVRESLEFCFPLITKDTPFEKTKLIIEMLPLKLECKACQKVTEIQKINLKCPQCESSEVHLISGKEFYIANMEIN